MVQTLAEGFVSAARDCGVITRMTASRGLKLYERQQRLGSDGFGEGQSSVSNGRSITTVLMARPPPEPSSWVERGARVRKICPISYYYFVVEFLLKCMLLGLSG
ncbi:unnamed protein product [Cuscuta europaea]|uniref:Uncharacterized protein n=1 Tax=Cuscuta europaea TaxID=41803 RepID=A0A9P0ZDB6_CUSEU|nr:unnamed protein product [Cuscuta europaea]